MLNKRGMTPSAIMGTIKVVGYLLIALIIVGILITFANSGTFRLLVIGLVVMVFSAFMLFKMNTGGKSFYDNYLMNVFMVFLLILSLGYMVYTSTIQASALGEAEVIGGLVFGTLDCTQAEGGIKETPTYRLGTDGEAWLEAPENSVNYNLLLSYPDLGYFEDIKIVYYECSEAGNMNSCNSPTTIYIYENTLFSDVGDTDVKIMTNIASNKAVKIEFYKETLFSWTEDDSNRAELKMEYQPYALLRSDVLQGGATWINNANCDYPSSELKLGGITSSDDSNYEVFQARTSLKPNEKTNYISGIVQMIVEKASLTAYNGEAGYCIDTGSSANVYGLSSVRTSDGTTHKIVDTTDILGSVECCNGLSYGAIAQCIDFKLEEIQVEEILDSDGNLVSAISNIECSIYNPLPIGKQVYDNKMSFTWDCDDGFGVMTAFTEEECALSEDCDATQSCINFQCKDVGEISDALVEGLKCGENQVSQAVSNYGLTWTGLKAIPTGEYECVYTTAYKQKLFLIFGVIGMILFALVVVITAPKNKTKTKAKRKKK